MRLADAAVWILCMIMGFASIGIASKMATNLDTELFGLIEAGTVEYSMLGVMGVILFYLMGPMCFLLAYCWNNSRRADDLEERIEKLEKQEVSNDEA